MATPRQRECSEEPLAPPASGKVRLLRPRSVDVVDIANVMDSDRALDAAEAAVLKEIADLQSRRGSSRT